MKTTEDFFYVTTVVIFLLGLGVFTINQIFTLLQHLGV